MYLLKRENWWIWLLLAFLSGGSSILVLGALLNIYQKDAWYAKWYIWLAGIVLLMVPFSIMTVVLFVYALTQVCSKLGVAGKELYLCYYLWIGCLILPFIGWAIFIIMFIYLSIAYLIALYRGGGEQYLN